MIASEIERLERELGSPLPDGYREFLLAYPVEASTELRRYDLFDNADAVIEQTRLFRRYLTDDADPTQHLVIGDSGCGDRICLDVNSSEILFWSHIDEDFAPLADSIDEYYRIAAVEVD